VPEAPPRRAFYAERFEPRLDILPAAQREICPQLAALARRAFVLYGAPNNLWNKRSDSRRPSSVNTTDFALPTGSEIMPFSCSRFIASRSKPFQVR
jgi:hypothetical protein